MVRKISAYYCSAKTNISSSELLCAFLSYNPLLPEGPAKHCKGLWEGDVLLVKEAPLQMIGKVCVWNNSWKQCV
ncbi:hypothetical protein FKM82_025150 [Ascaphus truei]